MGAPQTGGTRITVSRVLGFVTITAFLTNLMLLALPGTLIELLTPAEASAEQKKGKNTMTHGDASSEALPHDAVTVDAAENDAAPKAAGPNNALPDDASMQVAPASESSPKDAAMPGADGSAAAVMHSEKSMDADGSAASAATDEADPSADDVASAGVNEAADKAFRKIVHTFENMEPVHAGSAIVSLSERDMMSAVRTLMAMNPRKSGAILDAIATKSPDAAANIAVEMLAEATPEAHTPAR